MLRLATYLLFLLYFTVQAKTYWPFVEFALNRDYIARDRCINRDKVAMDCQGRCYLQQALRQSGQQDQDNTPQAPSSRELSWQPHLLPEQGVCAQQVYVEVEERPEQKLFRAQSPQPLYPPPRMDQV